MVRKSIPLARQVAQEILAGVEAGKLARANGVLPSEAELSERFDVTRATIGEALAQLEHRGVVMRRHGVGTFVTALPRLDAGLEELESLETLARRTGLETRMNDLRIEERAATDTEIEALQITAAYLVLCVSRVIIANKRPVAYLIDSVPTSILKRQDLDKNFRGSIVGEFLPNLAMIWIVASIIIKITYKRQIQAEAQAAQATQTAEAESLKRQVVEARMAAMQAQIEPHFLFNTLASIVHLIEVDPKRASAMQNNLIALLRAAMPTMREAGDGAPRALGRELAVIRPYLEILKVRMEARLRTTIDVPDGLLSAEFPALMLQGLVGTRSSTAWSPRGLRQDRPVHHPPGGGCAGRNPGHYPGYQGRSHQPAAAFPRSGTAGLPALDRS